MINYFFFMSIIAGYVLLIAQYRSDQGILNDTRLDTGSHAGSRRLSYYQEATRENVRSGQEMRSKESWTRRDIMRDVRQYRVGNERNDRIRSDSSISRREFSVLRDVEDRTLFNDLRDTRMYNRENDRSRYDERSNRQNSIILNERQDQRRVSNYREEDERHFTDVRDSSQRRIHDVREEDKSRVSHVRGQEQGRVSNVREEDRTSVSQTRHQDIRANSMRSRDNELNLNRERFLREVRDGQRVRDSRDNRREETSETRRQARISQDREAESSQTRHEMSHRERDTRVGDDFTYRIELESKANTKSDPSYRLALINWIGLMTIMLMYKQKQIREKLGSFTQYITI